MLLSLKKTHSKGQLANDNSSSSDIDALISLLIQESLTTGRKLSKGSGRSQSRAPENHGAITSRPTDNQGYHPRTAILPLSQETGLSCHETVRARSLVPGDLLISHQSTDHFSLFEEERRNYCQRHLYPGIGTHAGAAETCPTSRARASALPMGPTTASGTGSRAVGRRVGSDIRASSGSTGQEDCPGDGHSRHGLLPGMALAVQNAVRDYAKSRVQSARTPPSPSPP